MWSRGSFIISRVRSSFGRGMRGGVNRYASFCFAASVASYLRLLGTGFVLIDSRSGSIS